MDDLAHLPCRLKKQCGDENGLHVRVELANLYVLFKVLNGFDVNYNFKFGSKESLWNVDPTDG